MKKLILIMLVLSMFVILSCKMSEPNIKTDYVGLTPIEVSMQYEYDKCGYMQQYTEVDLRCDNILQRNGKIKIILIYNILETGKQLPLIYRKLGAEAMTFDDFFKYIQ